MNIFNKILGKKLDKPKPLMKQPSNETLSLLQTETDKLWATLSETLSYYNEISCQCAFPRFRQFTSIDCLDYRGSFYMSETEGFIHHAKQYFNIEKIEKGTECYNAIYTCKKCSSTFDCGWSDFSIQVNRTYLKPISITVDQIGADIKTPIPFFIGLFGHKLADLSLFQKVDFETFSNYIGETKNVH
jgi:hypothetical protein